MTKKICDLPECNKKARRRFCSNRHKDMYHNRANPRGIAARYNPNSPEYDPVGNYQDTIHPFSSEGLGQD